MQYLDLTVPEAAQAMSYPRDRQILEDLDRRDREARE